jgi:hypothetical protein
VETTDQLIEALNKMLGCPAVSALPQSPWRN